MTVITQDDHHNSQSRTQSPQAFWSAGRRQERLWDNGISYPRKRGIPVFVRMLKIKTEVKCPKMAVVLMFSGLKVLSGLESVRESQSWLLHAIEGTGFFSRKSGSKQLDFLSCKSERTVDLIRHCYNIYRQVNNIIISLLLFILTNKKEPSLLLSQNCAADCVLNLCLNYLPPSLYVSLCPNGICFKLCLMINYCFNEHIV